MDDLCEIDSSVSSEALVCIMVPTAGEKMKNLKHVLLGAYSQRLWPSMMYTSRQLRVAILDEKGRHEVSLQIVSLEGKESIVSLEVYLHLGNRETLFSSPPSQERAISSKTVAIHDTCFLLLFCFTGP